MQFSPINVLKYFFLLFDNSKYLDVNMNRKKNEI